MIGRNPKTRMDERVTVVTRALSNGQLLYMLFVAPERDAASQNRVMNAMLQSIDVR
jgi:hypothetical protein